MKGLAPHTLQVFEAVSKLLIAYSLSLSVCDKLIFYGALIMLLQLTIRMMYTVYCRRHFAETKFCFFVDKKIMLVWNFQAFLFMQN